MAEKLGKIKNIEVVHDFKTQPIAGVSVWAMDGYKVVTDKHVFYVLIDSFQDCCESWGYLSSEDDLSYFIGAELLEVRLTDKALNQSVVDKSDYYNDAGGIQFVDFVTNNGVFQLAVYNAHNGYYGHGVLIAREDDMILLNDIF